MREYVDKDALEEVLKSSPPPLVLHISTHGFFLPNQAGENARAELPLDLGNAAVAGKSLLAVAENPLRRSGLVLAGANRLDEAAESLTDVDDGWVTAEEIAMMDLQGTSLVVLSACESGLGDVATGEGVYGLKRAFQNAGAKTIISTLFEVPDRESAQLMKGFYERLKNKKSKVEALHDAQLDQIRGARERYGAAHPFFWAGFVLTGDPN